MENFTLKKLMTFVILSVAMITAGNAVAAGDTIRVSDFQFTPNMVTVDAGDTVWFVWVSGHHPTASNSGAWATFDVTSTNPIHPVVLTIPGNYLFHCEHHPVMTGTIVVNPGSGFGEKIEAADLLSIFPNPVVNTATINFSESKFDELVVYNVIGERIFVTEIKSWMSSVDVNLSNWPAGTYFFSVSKNGVMKEIRKFIKF